jgi:hypothetical protein
MSLRKNMLNYNRRDFIKTSANILGGAALSGLTLSCHKNETVCGKWAGFKYAMCNESMAGSTWDKQCRIHAAAHLAGSR